MNFTVRILNSSEQSFTSLESTKIFRQVSVIFSMKGFSFPLYRLLAFMQNLITVSFSVGSASKGTTDITLLKRLSYSLGGNFEAN